MREGNPFTHALHEYVRPNLADKFAQGETVNVLIFGNTQYNGMEKCLLTKMMDDNCLRANVNRALGEMTRIQTVTAPPTCKQEELHLLLQELFIRWSKEKPSVS